MTNSFEYTFTLSINGGEPQSIEAEGHAETWQQLEDNLAFDMRSLVRMNAAMGLKDWHDD